MIPQKLFEDNDFRWHPPATGHTGYWLKELNDIKLSYYPREGWCYVDGLLVSRTIDEAAYRKLYFKVFNEKIKE